MTINKTSQAMEELLQMLRDDVTSGYTVLRNAAELLPAIAEKYRKMEEALQAEYEWLGLSDSSPNETFERIGEMFYRDTGFLRPGKSDAPALYNDDREKKRAEAWREWCKRKNEEHDQQLRDALSFDPLS